MIVGWMERSDTHHSLFRPKLISIASHHPSSGLALSTARHGMRCFIAVLLLLGALICPREADALDCPMLPPSKWFKPADGSEIATEAQRQDVEAGAALEQLERFPIIFRGRAVSARWLSDL